MRFLFILFFSLYASHTSNADDIKNCLDCLPIEKDENLPPVEDDIELYYQDDDGTWKKVDEGVNIPYKKHMKDGLFTRLNSPTKSKQSWTGLVPLHKNEDIPINLNLSFNQSDDGYLIPSINDFSYNGITYFPSYVDNTEWDRFDAQSSSFYIPPALSQLIEGNSLIGLDEENLLIFAALPGKDTINPTSPHAFGVTLKSSFDNGLMMSNTIGTMKENGFFGLNSIDRFGFDKEMTNLFLISDFNKTFKSLDYGLRFESHISPNSYDSDIISWSNLSLSKLSLDIGHSWNKQRINFSIKSPLQTYGKFNSDIDGLKQLDDFYNEDATLQISYQSNMDDNESINTKLSTDDGGALYLNYELKF